MLHLTMTRLRPLLLGVFLAVLGLSVATAPAGAQGTSASTEDEIQQMLEERDQEIKSILEGGGDYTSEQRERLKELINGVIDFRIMAQTALGPHWDTLSTARRDTFVTVFRDVVRAQSMSDFDVYNSRVTFDQISVQDDSAFVRTTTEYEGTRTPVEYVLERREEEWRAEDIIVDEVSTAEGYARSFQSVIRKRGFDALMTSLERKRAEEAGSR